MYRKNTSGQFVCVQLLLTATGAVATGLSPTVRRCIDGTFAAATGTVTEDSAGFYKFAMSQADTNGNDISLTFSATGAMPVCVNFVTTAADPTDTVRFGLTAMPNVASGSAGALIVSGTGTAALSVSSGLVTLAGVTHSGAVIPTVTTVTNQLTAAAIATGIWQDTTSGDFTVSSSIGKSLYTSGNAPGAASGIALVGSNMGTITGALTAAQIATGVWTDTTAGDFTTALSIGKSLMNGVSLGTGLTVNDITTKTGYSLSGTQTFNLTGSITGSLSGSVGSVTGAVGSVTGAVGSVTGAVGSVTGNVGGNVVGSVASVTARVTANTDQINGNATSAANLAKSAESIVRGTCSGGTTTTAVVSSMTTPATLTAAGQLIGRTILFDDNTTTAALQGQASNITNNTTGATPTITFTAMTTAPANTDTFSIL